MITGALKRDIDALWTEFWQGGITNPLTVIEQVTFLMFARLLDINETRDENRMRRTQKPFKRRFDDDEQHLRWSQFRHLGAEEMLPLVRDEVFPHFRKSSTSGSAFAEFMKDAQLMIQKPSLLVKAVNMIDKLPLTEGDTKGDLYEYLLSKLTTAGINGQFRTPRHIIKLMVELLDPRPTETVGDPSAGTGGFLVETMQYLMKEYTSPEGIIEETDPETGKTEKIYTGDLLEDHREHIRSNMFHGFDFDATMLRIAAMNLMLHGVDNPDIHYQDTLSTGFSDKYPQAASDGFDLILANPPFKGSLDFEDVHPGLLRKVKTKKTELLFLVLILRMLKTGGRSATIVPDGVLFGSSTAHVALRRQLLDENQLEAVISLPSGVFKPYAGVSTGILVFTKGGRTADVFFYDVEADGFSLDDKRDPIEANDLPNCLKAWKKRDPQKDTDRTQKAFFVPAEEIRGSNYDLSLGRYKDRTYVEEEYDPPVEILTRMKQLNREIEGDIAELERMLK
ncbi:type I restriction-modification system subunit M [Ruegeria arenilitoris]|uniref:type I restriction-modification system subunit M n=1 Tax=Ruegeria arenilitoris TaxID=1173585 RepID=UPI00148157F5|nr:class I SAM-dependent DNA methyltransferase [Ruegeria arenilitoris]